MALRGARVAAGVWRFALGALRGVFCANVAPSTLYIFPDSSLSRRVSEKKPEWSLLGPDANARRSTIPGAALRTRQRVPERFAARQARFAALQARFEASLAALQARFAALRASFEASLEAFQASFAALRARLTAALHARARAFHARFQRCRARVNARFGRSAHA